VLFYHLKVGLIVNNRFFSKILVRLQSLVKHLPKKSKKADSIVFVVILGITLSATFYISYRATVSNTINAEIRFQTETEQLSIAIKSHFASYINLVRGLEALLVSSGATTSDEWNKYIDTLDIRTNYPGVAAVGYAEIIPAQKRASYEERTGFTITENYPYTLSQEKSSYTPITYWRSPSGDNAKKPPFGFDLSSDPSKHAVLQEALETRDIVLSDKTLLLKKVEGSRPIGALLVAPIFDKDTKSRAIGTFVELFYPLSLCY